MEWMFTTKELVTATGGKLQGKGLAAGVTGVSIDSREIKKGECFVALRGAHFDGKDFISEAVSKGAGAVITSNHFEQAESVTCISVGDAITALGDIASHWRKKFSAPAVAITGSNGKSTTKQMVTAALGSLGPVLKTEGNFNNLIGLPLTVLRWTAKDKVAVLEMGMSEPGEIARLTQIARPQIGLITNVSPAHLELLQNIENVAKAKGELFDNMKDDGTVIVNLEDPWVKKIAEGYKGRVYTFGMQNDADVRFGRMESKGLESVDMILYVEGEEHQVHLPVPGTHNVMNAMAAISIARVLNVPASKAIEGLEKFEPMSMRMERLQLSNGVQLINDCYNANPISVKEALRTVSGAKRAGRLIVVLGDMLGLGKNAPQCHREVGAAAAQYKVDKLFVFGEHSADIVGGASQEGMNSENIDSYADIDKLKKDVFDFVSAGDVILIKGSRGVQMERVTDYLKDEIGVE
jgi:UDP-N-acetylmuramoyl-tripeptide--D-alanyl-D-alanine ligase